MTLTYIENDGTVDITHKFGSCKLPVIELNWYQPMSPFPSENIFSLSGEVFQKVISQVSFCIDQESAIDALTCMIIKPIQEERVDFCGLDGHRFAMYSISSSGIGSKLPKDGLLIQKWNLHQINRWLNKCDIDISYNDRRLFFRNNCNEILSIPLVNFAYPDYTNFLSKLNVDTVSYLTVNRKDLQQALSRMSIVNSEINSYIDFNISEDKKFVYCSAKGDDSGEVEEKINISYDGDIKKISFRTKEFLTILDHFKSEEITMKMTTFDGPCSIQGPDDPFYVVVIMPLTTVNPREEFEVQDE